MLSTADIKRIRSLAQKKFRDELGLFTVEGEKMVAEALASSFAVEAVYRREEIGEKAMERISSLSSPSPALAVVRQKPESPLTLPDKGLCLVLDGIRDPGNLGTLLRIAAWFGIAAVYASPDCVDWYNPKVVQATMGALFRVPFHTADLPTLCRSVAAKGGKVYGTFLDGKDIYAEELTPDGLIIMGNEGNGISDKVRQRINRRLLIPDFHQGETADSLNVAIATAITCSEFRRRAVRG
jgi:TrmH family RNA methyltransferase